MKEFRYSASDIIKPLMDGYRSQQEGKEAVVDYGDKFRDMVAEMWCMEMIYGRCYTEIVWDEETKEIVYKLKGETS